MRVLELGVDLHFAVLVSVLQSMSMQLLSVCGVRELGLGFMARVRLGLGFRLALF